MATGPRKQKTPEGAVGKKDNGKKDLVSRWLTDDQVMTAAVGRPTSGVGWDWPAPPIKPIYPQPLVREGRGGTKRAGRKPARKRQELDLTPFQDQCGQYGSASSRDRIRAEVDGWRYAGTAEARAKLAKEWGLGPAAQMWLDGPSQWPTDYREYLRCRAQDAVSAIRAGRRIFKDTVSRPAATKILGVWQDGRKPVPAPAPAQKPVPPSAPAQPSRPAAPVMRAAPVLTHRIPKHERGPVALALEKALRESGLTLEEKQRKVEIYRVRHGIRVSILD